MTISWCVLVNGFFVDIQIIVEDPSGNSEVFVDVFSVESDILHFAAGEVLLC